ncbi:MAG: prepilin-type N-terminal cleavage/methylation domain-containing protein [Candidatus Omnitrophota bacterium]
MRKKGFTLIEVVVAMIIILITLTGLIHLFVAGKKLILHSHARMTVGELGKVFMDPLQMQVRQDTWDVAGNSLLIVTGADSTTWTGAAEGLNGIDFTPDYTVARVKDASSNDTGLRRVTVTVQWEEPSP